MIKSRIDDPLAPLRFSRRPLAIALGGLLPILTACSDGSDSGPLALVTPPAMARCA